MDLFIRQHILRLLLIAGIALNGQIVWRSCGFQQDREQAQSQPMEDVEILKADADTEDGPNKSPLLDSASTVVELQPSLRLLTSGPRTPSVLCNLQHRSVRLQI